MTAFDETFDMVVIGSGGGSMCAAIVAADARRSTLILEKQAKVGGSTAYSGGVWWIPNNPLMARDGVADSHERARTYFDAAVSYTGPGTSPQRREAFLRSGPEMVEFLERKGIEFERPDGYADYYDDLPGGEPRGRALHAKLFDINELGQWRDRLAIYPGRTLRISVEELPQLTLIKTSWKARRVAVRVGVRMAVNALRHRDTRGAGAAMQGRMLQLALREGVTIRPDTKVTGFLVDHGRVIGVVAEHRGQTLRIGARDGVLINVGGFSHNSRLRETHGPAPAATRWTLANPGDTGEVIEVAVGLGAATDCLDEAWWQLTSLAPDGSFPQGATTETGEPVPFGHHFDISLPHVILVDQDGKRFTNEAGSYMENGQRLYERHKQTSRGIPAWAIIESRHRNRYLWGATLGRTPKAWIESGYMKVAPTIDELARQCGIDEAGLRDTVDRFNGFAATGVDLDYRRGARVFDRYHGDPTNKPNPTLGAIEKPPFYAVAIYPSDVGTAGGLVTDPDARVLKDDGAVIEGLYATGNSTASVMGRTYPGAGASIAASFVFAYRAALHMASQNRSSPQPATRVGLAHLRCAASVEQSDELGGARHTCSRRPDPAVHRVPRRSSSRNSGTSQGPLTGSVSSTSGRASKRPQACPSVR
jgi:3-oxosteroid 1-dehydrogenase